MVKSHTTYTERAPRVHRCGAALLGLLLLVGCNAPQIEYVPYQATESYRDRSAPIGATSRFVAREFFGNWRVRYAMAPDNAPYWVDFAEITHSYDFSMRQHFADCELGNETCDTAKSVSASTSDDSTGALNFRFATRDSKIGYTRDFWVLWVDEGFRTAAIGAPDGSFAWILDRSAKGGADRIKAAREILDFNGYDVSQLKVKK